MFKWFWTIFSLGAPVFRNRGLRFLKSAKCPIFQASRPLNKQQNIESWKVKIEDVCVNFKKLFKLTSFNFPLWTFSIRALFCICLVIYIFF